MADTSIIQPMLALVALPFLILVLNALRKASDRRAGKQDVAASAVDNKAWSLPVVLTSNSLENQFQLPVLFYVICLTAAITQSSSTILLGLAWVYVALRYLHAFVHVTTNYIPARFLSFLFSTLVLLVMFVLVVMAVV